MALKPPTHHSTLPLRSLNVMDIPLQKATKRQLASGTAPTHVRAPAKYWFGPDIWPDIAEAAIQKGWSAGGIVSHLTTTAAGKVRFQGLTQATVWKMFDCSTKPAQSWSTRTLGAVESEKNCRLVQEPLGRPHMFVGPCPHVLADDADHSTFEGKAPWNTQEN